MKYWIISLRHSIVSKSKKVLLIAVWIRHEYINQSAPLNIVKGQHLDLDVEKVEEWYSRDVSFIQRHSITM